MSSRAVSLLSRVISQNRGLASLRETVGERDASLLYEPKFQDSREFPEYVRQVLKNLLNLKKNSGTTQLTSEFKDTTLDR